VNTALGDWTLVVRAEDFPAGTRRVVEVGGTRVVVFNLDDDYYAIEDVCTHDGGDLASGALEGCEIVCPRHGARFNVRTGAVAAPPAYEPIATMEVRIVDGWVWVRDSRWD
jgi:3-phenylpropionate/trans-cinnamate dioxygenase ferredoxin component